MTNSKNEGGSPSMSWQAEYPLLREPVVLKQLALVIVIPVGLVFLFLLILQSPHSWERFWWLFQIMIGISLFIFLLFTFVIVVFYSGKYQVRYTLDDQGITARQGGRVVRLLPWVKWALILSGRPSAMGAGILAQSSGVESVKWKDVGQIVEDAQKHTLALRKGKRVLMVLHCNEDNYEEVLHYCQESVGL